ncbi:MAG TPA: hypothetical protein VF669_17040 [Tepidisphaeraceae bacterium]
MRGINVGIIVLLVALLAAEGRGGEAGSATAPGQVVYVKTSGRWGNDQKHRPLMVRELFRQALMVAARDEMGLVTRDQELGETQEANQAFEVVPAGSTPVTIKVYAGEGAAAVFDQTFQVPDWGGDCTGLVTAAEKLSRKEFVELLHQKGFDGKTAAQGNGEVPAGVEELLGEMNLFSQFSAVRQVHQAMRESGESPALLGALARGYAHLGQLTNYHWTSEHKALKARSLLYAERLVAANPRSANALWHRAYARALVGIQGAAAKDLGAAEKLSNENMPTWVPLITAYCNYDTGKLMELSASNVEQAPLASFLALLTVEHCGSRGAVRRLAGIAVEANPECLRVIDIQCENAGATLLRNLIEEEPQVLGQMMANHLRNLPDLDAAIVDAIDGNADFDTNSESRQKILDAMIAEGGKDRIEPSWGVLGWLVKQEVFTQVARRARAMRERWDEDPAEYAQSVSELVKDHPYKSYIDVCKLGNAAPKEAIREALGKPDLADANYMSEPLAVLMYEHGVESGLPPLEPWFVPMAHSDAISGDPEWVMDRCSEHRERDEFRNSAIALGLISPRAPTLLALMIKDNWAAAQPLVKQVEERQENHPAIAFALALKYTELKQLDAAKRSFKHYIEIAQDLEGYGKLAELYKSEGKMDEWLSTLEDFLKQGEPSLDHARVRVQIAQGLWEQGKFVEAVPYADEAAETKAAWAMQWAAQAHECVGEWEKAEAFVSEQAQWYHEPEDWYLWCVRTGHGDAEKALQAVEDSLEARREREDRETLASLGTFFLVRKDYESALKYLEKSVELFGDAYAGLHAALIYDDQKDVAKRDAVLTAVIERGGQHVVNDRVRTEMVTIAKLAKAAFAGTGKMTKADVEAALGGLPEQDACNACYFAGRYLERFGEKDTGLEYLKRCAGGSDFAQTNLVLSHVELRERGMDPSKLLRVQQEEPAK